MDLNEKNNDSVSVRDVYSKNLKIQPVECANSDASNESIDLKLKKSDSIIEKRLEEIQLNQKRKVPERSALNMEKDMLNLNESIKRRRYTDSEKEDAISINSLSKGEKEPYKLSITNSPGTWSLKEVISFVIDECGLKIASVSDSTDNDYKVLLQFDYDNKQRCQEALAKLKEKEAQGKLSVHLLDNVKPESESDAESEETAAVEEIKPNEEEEIAGPSTPCQEVSVDSNDNYIRESYLESLGIKPPITSWVIVTDFRCDKSELRDVLELAGRVLICSVSMNTKHANVMYSHPLEALQAVSMLNGRQYYGKKLQVTMNNATEPQTILPKGLVDVGPGLGKYGKPLLDVVEQYKLFLIGKPSFLDACIFETSFLKKLGLSMYVNAANLTRRVSISSSQNETDTEGNESPIEKESTQKSETSNFGPVGQKPDSVPVMRQQVQPVPNSVAPRPPFLNPIQPMQGPIRGPVHAPVGPRGPTARAMVGQITYPIVNSRLMYPSTAPGHDTGNDPHVNGMITGPRVRGINASTMTGPRGSMVGPNRFPAPHSMMGPQPAPSVAHRPMTTPNGPARPNFPLGPNVRIFQGPDPMMLQISNSASERNSPEETTSVKEVSVNLSVTGTSTFTGISSNNERETTDRPIIESFQRPHVQYQKSKTPEIINSEKQLTEAFGCLNAISSKRKEELDEYDQFGYIIASKIRKIEDIDRREMLMNSIQNQTFEFYMRNYHKISPAQSKLQPQSFSFDALLSQFNQPPQILPAQSTLQPQSSAYNINPFSQMNEQSPQNDMNKDSSVRVLYSYRVDDAIMNEERAQSTASMVNYQQLSDTLTAHPLSSIPSIPQVCEEYSQQQQQQQQQQHHEQQQQRRHNRRSITEPRKIQILSEEIFPPTAGNT